MFPPSPSSPLQQEHSSPRPAARPSLTRQAWSWLQPRRNSNATSQDDVEYLGSDVSYDDTQASFRVEKTKGSGRGFFDSSNYRENFPSPPRSRSFSHSIRPSPYMNQPTRNYAQAARRSLDVMNGDQQKQWFNPDPESARIAVPPLSVEHKMDDHNTSATQLLYDREEQQENDNKQVNKKQQHQQHQDTSPNKYHVVSNKQSPPPMKENIFDNDIENWKPHISGNTRE